MVDAAPYKNTSSLIQESIAHQLGWISCDRYQCGGYYLEQPFLYSIPVKNEKFLEITSQKGFISRKGTSILEQDVSITRHTQQMTAQKAYLYRDTKTGKLRLADVFTNVHLREPNTLIIADRGQYFFQTNKKRLCHITYRTALHDKKIIGPHVPKSLTSQPRIINTLTAWGQADQFLQNEPRVYDFTNASFSTCPPVNPAWRIKAKHINLNKKTGRGTAWHTTFLIKNTPVFYIPYLNFSIDRTRKTGFLWPTIGGSNKWGPYFLAPFYWNMAPNYDMTITPGYLSKRGVQLTDHFRYLTSASSGDMILGILPYDVFFRDFQNAARDQFAPLANAGNPVIQSELNRLLDYSIFRKGFVWRDESRFNDHLSFHLDFNYAGDDYYYRDFGSNLNEITQNQLLQEAELDYQSEHWEFFGRLHAYQTLHPIDEPQVTNQYRRLPQLVLNGTYPDQAFGLTYFIANEISRFDILKNPGASVVFPVGNRLHTQLGASLPFSRPYFFLQPRLQLALTHYNLHQTSATNTPSGINRGLPIFDLASGITLTRDFRLFQNDFQQTLEPQIYYVYIPYRNQSNIPLFDTTTQTLTYEQLFNYNRFTGIDRIGDANQVGLGVMTRFIDGNSGIEKVRLGLGDIIYLSNRRVTLCQSPTICSDNPANPSNKMRLSPLSGLLNISLIPNWSFSAASLWGLQTKQLANATLSLHYQTDNYHIFNAAYTFARNGDILSGIITNDSKNNLKVTDISVVWPVFSGFSIVGRWSQSWNEEHLQNLIYGVQYDTCCWAVRMVGGRAYLGLDPSDNNKLQYNNEFYIQFALKGLGNIGSGDPSGLLSNIAGYQTKFGQEL